MGDGDVGAGEAGFGQRADDIGKILGADGERQVRAVYSVAGKPGAVEFGGFGMGNGPADDTGKTGGT